MMLQADTAQPVIFSNSTSPGQTFVHREWMMINYRLFYVEVGVSDQYVTIADPWTWIYGAGQTLREAAADFLVAIDEHAAVVRS